MLSGALFVLFARVSAGSAFSALFDREVGELNLSSALPGCSGAGWGDALWLAIIAGMIALNIRATLRCRFDAGVDSRCAPAPCAITLLIIAAR